MTSSSKEQLAFELTLSPAWRFWLKELLEDKAKPPLVRALRNHEDALRLNYDLGLAEGAERVLKDVERLAKQHVGKQESLTKQVERQMP
jgi:hypothetical protein